MTNTLLLNLAWLLGLTAPPDWHTLPVLLTVYDPARGGINCDSDCGHWADGTPVNLPEQYMAVAACIPQIPVDAVISIPGVGRFRCRDRGGAVKVAYNDYWQRWVVHVDIAADVSGGYPSWNYQLVQGWRVSGGYTTVGYNGAGRANAGRTPRQREADYGALWRYSHWQDWPKLGMARG